MTITFEEAVAAARSVADPGEEVANFGFQGEAEWIVLTLPLAIGLWCAYVDQETSAVRWASETDEAYLPQVLVGDWPEAERAEWEPLPEDPADEALLDEPLTAGAMPIDYVALFRDPDSAHTAFCRNPLHPGPCKHVFDVPKGRKRRKRPLTGHFTFGRSRWWDQLTEDDDEGQPVDNLTIQISQREYHVQHGTVYRINGVAYLVEHDPSDQSTRNATQAVQMVYDFHAKRIAPVDEGYQKAYFIAERESPTEADKHASGALEPDRHIAGQAGDGSTSVWGYTRDYFRPGDIAPIVSHEYGHNVGHGAPRVTDPVTGEVRRVDESRGWLDAGMADARRGGPQSRVTGAQIDPGDQVARRWFSELNAGMIPDSPYPVGVTPYGTTSMREDFAESVSMYLTGQIATGFPMDGVDALTDEDVPIYFRDYFPARAAELDKLFPTFAQRQLEQIRQERSQSGS